MYFKCLSLSHSSVLDSLGGHAIKQLATGITRPLHATGFKQGCITLVAWADKASIKLVIKRLSANQAKQNWYFAFKSVYIIILVFRQWQQNVLVTVDCKTAREFTIFSTFYLPFINLNGLSLFCHFL